MAGIIKPKRKNMGIPTSSMSDISFLLLLFFMVTTVFVKYKGLKVRLPKAENIKKVSRTDATTIYIKEEGKGDSKVTNLTIDDYQSRGRAYEQVLDDLLKVLQIKRSENPQVIVCFRTDSSVEYGTMEDVMQKLKEAYTLRVNFEAKPKLGR